MTRIDILRNEERRLFAAVDNNARAAVDTGSHPDIRINAQYLLAKIRVANFERRFRDQESDYQHLVTLVSQRPRIVRQALGINTQHDLKFRNEVRRII